jgi:hypothetical protein
MGHAGALREPVHINANFNSIACSVQLAPLFARAIISKGARVGTVVPPCVAPHVSSRRKAERSTWKSPPLDIIECFRGSLFFDICFDVIYESTSNQHIPASLRSASRSCAQTKHPYDVTDREEHQRRTYSWVSLPADAQQAVCFEAMPMVRLAGGTQNWIHKGGIRYVREEPRRGGNFNSSSLT